MHPDNEHMEAHVQETEIKLAFLEKELEAYKEAVQELHARLTSLEKTVRELGDAAGSAQDASEAPETDGS
jgi:prefoldin subunit 5